MEKAEPPGNAAQLVLGTVGLGFGTLCLSTCMWPRCAGPPGPKMRLESLPLYIEVRDHRGRASCPRLGMRTAVLVSSSKEVMGGT